MAEIIKHFSNFLQREMTVRVYGRGGKPMLVVPCQDAMSDNFENFGMDKEFSYYLDSGKMTMFSVDTIDKETFSDEFGNNEHRAYMQEQYYNYVIEEVLPIIRARCGEDNLPVVTGCSLGATHAAIFFFRRPDLFSGIVALSGCYDVPYFWHGWCNETLYNNSPISFLQNMPSDHPYISLYNSRKAILCVGQGRWEDLGIPSQRELERIFKEKGISVWTDFWGYDVDHDWPWWRKQYAYFLPFIFE